MPGMIDTNLGTNTQLLEEWKSKEAFQRQMELLKKHVMNDLEESCKAVIPYAISSCKKDGKVFKG